jgi:beta-aspartyl-peptidase (threonine type)
MTNSEHVMLAGEGAIEFARQNGVEFGDDEYFFTEHRYRQLQDAIREGRIQLDHEASAHGTGPLLSEPGAGRGPQSGIPTGVVDAAGFSTTKQHETTRNKKETADPYSALHTPQSKGTVGAVACDTNGNLAAATSTGGMTNKKYGRIGDTPIIGAGTYADNSTCAVSCTGHGEYFMRTVTAYDIAARMKYADSPLEEAAGETILHLSEVGGEGGLIAVDAKGNVALPFNSEGMYRGFMTSKSEAATFIYR